MTLGASFLNTLGLTSVKGGGKEENPVGIAQDIRTLQGKQSFSKVTVSNHEHYPGNPSTFLVT